jgi:hypothetical protein
LLTLRFENEKSVGRFGSAFTVGCALALGCAMAPLTRAGSIANFTGSYALNQFTLANINIQPEADPNGTATSPDAGLTLLLTGGLSGSGDLGETDFYIDAAQTGMVQFNWMFANGVSGFISGGYLLDGTSSSSCIPCTTLSETSGTGQVMFAVTEGEPFGFFVITDNQANTTTGLPGILTITDFSAPGNSSSVPEPGTAAMLMVAGGVAAARGCRLHRRRNQVL